MKRLLLAGLVFFLATGGAMAQNSIVGKWKVAGLTAEGMNFDLDKPEQTKKLLAEQFQKQAGKAPDTAMLEQMYTMLTSTFQTMVLEFTSNGKGIVSLNNPMSGEPKNDTASYTVDYAKGIVNTTSKEEGQEKNEQMKFKFEGEYLVMTKENEGVTLRLRRAKN